MEGAVRYYFGKNYKYTTILEFLEKFHDIKISKRTLLTAISSDSRPPKFEMLDINNCF